MERPDRLDYNATAVRLPYRSLPGPVQERIAVELGGEPVRVQLAGGGFTGGFAARVEAASGAALFVKAAGPAQPNVQRSYRQEMRIHPALPDGVPVPRMRFAAAVDDWVLIGFEAVRGVTPSREMTPDSLDLMLRAWAEAAAVLAPVPDAMRALGIVEVPQEPQLLRFTAVAGGEAEPFPVPPVLAGRIDELARLETVAEAAMRADAVSHFDLRPDNVLVGEDRAWICDWNWLRVQAQWFDTTNLLIVPCGDGHDADGLFWKHPTARGVEGEELDAVLASLVGFYLAQAPGGPIDGVSPRIREHQRWCGMAAADWLASRRGW
jgi:hypothetical protein